MCTYFYFSCSCTKFRGYFNVIHTIVYRACEDALCCRLYVRKDHRNKVLQYLYGSSLKMSQGYVLPEYSVVALQDYEQTGHIMTCVSKIMRMGGIFEGKWFNAVINNELTVADIIFAK